MPLAKWGPWIMTGIREIDSDHRGLLEAADALAESFKEGGAERHVKETMAFLVQFSTDHFQEEEEFMRGIGYPDLSTHAAEHAKQLIDVRNLQSRLEAGEHISIDVVVLLAEWLIHHIHHFDMKYVDFSKEMVRQGSPD